MMRNGVGVGERVGIELLRPTEAIKQRYRGN
jgi:hypothetical protein